jgi:hypothetical protein
MPSTRELPKEFFERCPRCLKTWDLFPVFRCPNCKIVFCGCCDEDDRPDDESRWLAAAWAEVEGLYVSGLYHAGHSFQPSWKDQKEDGEHPAGREF